MYRLHVVDMRVIPWISVRIVPLAFNGRYRLAGFTRKSKTFNKLVKKIMFEEDDMIVVPKDDVAHKVIETNIEIDDPGDTTVIPSDVVKTMIDRADDIFIMNFCLCRKSNKCDDYPVDHGCIFMGVVYVFFDHHFGRWQYVHPMAW